MKIIEELRNSYDPIMNATGLASGVGCLALGVLYRDTLIFGVGAVTTPTMRFVIKAQSNNNTAHTPSLSISKDQELR